MADIVLSIVPPSGALALAERLAPALARAARHLIYADCNAVSPQTVQRVGAVIAATGAHFVDAGVIGGPPKLGERGPVFYTSGPDAAALAVLSRQGLRVKPLDGAIGAASALKMSYAGITKGLTALGSAMMLAATRSGAAGPLRAELADSQSPNRGEPHGDDEVRHRARSGLPASPPRHGAHPRHRPEADRAVHRGRGG